jgi:hypothetical protein
MPNRREVLQLGAACSALALTPNLASASANSSAALPPLYKAIFDQRFETSRVFAEQMQQQGVAVHGMVKGDITPFWYHDLSKQWRQAPVAVAGVTQAGPLFCLEQLGAAVGMRVLHKREVQAATAQAPALYEWVLAPMRRV